MLKKHPELIVLAIVVLLFASKFVFFHYYVGTALQQVLLVAVAIGDQGSLGWGVTTLIAAICFIIAFASWFKGRVKGFFEKPTTFGSAEWATLDHIEVNGLVGLDGIRLGEFPFETGTIPLRYKRGPPFADYRTNTFQQGHGCDHPQPAEL